MLVMETHSLFIHPLSFLGHCLHSPSTALPLNSLGVTSLFIVRFCCSHSRPFHQIACPTFVPSFSLCFPHQCSSHSSITVFRLCFLCSLAYILSLKLSHSPYSVQTIPSTPIVCLSSLLPPPPFPPLPLQSNSTTFS